MNGLSIEDLPSQWADPMLASCISMDFQLYGKCNICGHETRLEMLGDLKRIKSKRKLPCFYYGQRSLEFVRHVMRQQLHCKECALEFQSQAMPWEPYPFQRLVRMMRVMKALDPLPLFRGTENA